MEDVDRGFPIDPIDPIDPVDPIGDAPEGDAVEQHQLVYSADEAGLDTEYLNAGDREANEADVIEQAFIVPADDDWDDDH